MDIRSLTRRPLHGSSSVLFRSCTSDLGSNSGSLTAMHSTASLHAQRKERAIVPKHTIFIVTTENGQAHASLTTNTMMCRNCGVNCQKSDSNSHCTRCRKSLLPSAILRPVDAAKSTDQFYGQQTEVFQRAFCSYPSEVSTHENTPTQTRRFQALYNSPLRSLSGAAVDQVKSSHAIACSRKTSANCASSSGRRKRKGEPSIDLITISDDEEIKPESSSSYSDQVDGNLEDSHVSGALDPCNGCINDDQQPCCSSSLDVTEEAHSSKDYDRSVEWDCLAQGVLGKEELLNLKCSAVKFGDLRANCGHILVSRDGWILPISLAFIYNQNEAATKHFHDATELTEQIARFSGDTLNGCATRKISVYVAMGNLRTIQFCISASMSIVVLSVDASYGNDFREVLRLPQQFVSGTPWFEPSSAQSCHKYITIILRQPVENSFVIKSFKQLLHESGAKHNFDVVDLPAGKANQLLMSTLNEAEASMLAALSASPVMRKENAKDDESGGLQSTHHLSHSRLSVSRSGSAEPRRRQGVRQIADNLGKSKQTERLFIYPFPPNRGGIAVNKQDVACLNDEQCLNDIIIDFYLKYLITERISENMRSRVHLFNTFFWKSLTEKKTASDNSNASSSWQRPSADARKAKAKSRHDQVQKWTKGVDVFAKDFVLVPINENYHWYLALICFPYKAQGILPQQSNNVGAFVVGKAPLLIATVTPSLPSVVPRNGALVVNVPLSAVLPSCETADPEETDELRNELAQVQMRAEQPSPACEGNVGASSPGDQSKTPCIIIFDSLLVASNHYRTVAILRDYLSIEWETNKGSAFKFDKHNMKGSYPVVPQQTNEYDCGVFLLQYAEQFFLNSPQKIDVPLMGLKQWFPPEQIAGKRLQIKALIDTMTSAWQQLQHGSTNSGVQIK